MPLNGNNFYIRKISMKKILIASAVMALFGVSQAAEAPASSIAISGSIAVSMQNTVAASGNTLDLSDSDINFSAKEDLGNGMSVSASTSLTTEKLRSNQVDANNTAIALTTGFGSVSYSNVLSGKAKMSAGVSAEDDMNDFMGGYSTVNVFNVTSPSIAGFTVGVEYAGDDASALAVSGTPNVIATWAGAGATVRVENGGAAKVIDVRATYNLGVANVGARWTEADRKEFTVSAPVGPMTVGYHYAKNGADHAHGAVASYAFSKQTSLSANYVTGNGNGFDGSNYRVQLKKTF